MLEDRYSIVILDDDAPSFPSNHADDIGVGIAEAVEHLCDDARQLDSEKQVFVDSQKMAV